MLSAVMKDEKALVGWLSANVSLGGAHYGVDRVKSVHDWLDPFMPLMSDLLTVGQVLVALATVVYMVLKVRKLWKQRKG